MHGINESTYDDVWGDVGTDGYTWDSLALMGEAWTTMINAFIWMHREHPLENGLRSSIVQGRKLIYDLLDHCPKAGTCLPNVEFLDSSLRSRLGYEEDAMTEEVRAEGVRRAQGADDERRVLVARAIPRLSSVCHGRSLFWTDRANMGMSHVSLSSGDHVWLLEGSSVPFILRGSSNNHMTMVGEAYVDGMMFGEMWSSYGGLLEDIVLE